MNSFSPPYPGIVNDRRRAAGARCTTFAIVIHLRRINPVEALRVRAKRTERLRSSRVFVVADKHRGAVFTRESSHAVVPGRNQQAVVHLFPVSGNNLV